MMEQLLALAEHFSLTVVEMEPIGNQFWAHVLACIKMPAGGINGRGSMHCSFSMDVPNESIVKFLMEDITFKPNERCVPAPACLAIPYIFSGLVANFLSQFCTASTLEANSLFISREMYLGFAQPRGK